MNDLAQTFTPVLPLTMSALSDEQVIAFVLTHGRAHPYDGYRDAQMQWARENVQQSKHLTPFKVIVSCRVIESLSEYPDERAAAAGVRQAHEKISARFATLRTQDELTPRRPRWLNAIAGLFS